jgi:uncharacterized protein (TIGR02145 family)
MVKFNYFYLIFTCLLGLTTYAQKVSNITYRQEQSNILVSYDLETKTPCKVNLYVSTNGGTSWQGPLKKVTGNVGDKVISGKKNIVWNVLEEFQELRGSNIKFQVRAEGSDFKMIKIGTQEWSTNNLNVSKYRNGDIIPEVKDFNKWLSLTTGAWCYYNNDPVNGSIYGKLYNWYAVNDPRGLAPEGFHIPSIDELHTITNLDTLANGKMIDIQNFEKLFYKSKIKVGHIMKPRGFENRIQAVYYWSSTEFAKLPGNKFVNGFFVNSASALTLVFGYNFRINPLKKYLGLYVRCVKD